MLSALPEPTPISIRLESFQVQVALDGLPEVMAGDVHLSMDWEEQDRVQVEADEFLDLPDQACPRTDAFQIFGSLESVGPIWMVDGPKEEAGESELTDAPEESFAPGVDPWGQKRTHRSWIAPSTDGPLPLVVPGPGRVRVSIHGIPGIWDSTELSAELSAEDPVTVLRFSVDPSALETRLKSL